MRSYWLWFLFNIIIWSFALIDLNHELDNMFAVLLGAVLYSVLFFIVPLLKDKPVILLSLLCVNALIASIIFVPVKSEFLILIITLLIVEGFYYLPLRFSLLQGGIYGAGLIIVLSTISLSTQTRIFLVIYIIMLITAMLVYKKTKEQADDLEKRYDALLSEYRDLKRRLVSEEEVARQEERMLIAHEIHDSVGHKLTALLMQLEAFRIQAAHTDKEKVQALKEIASASLEETRSAVKALKAKETGGLPGVLRLVRNLEMESLIRIHFTVKHGAFTAPLTGEQSFVIYRSVQEALTNIMKHSQAREAEIIFEAPGGSIFRFEISNPINGDSKHIEGFGLKSMRERLVKYGGSLDVIQTDSLFIVKGYLRIGYGGRE